MIWNLPENKLPKEGEYVLIYVPGMPWIDDSKTVFYRVACLEEKAETRADDYWHEFGPHSYSGSEVAAWAYIDECDLPIDLSKFQDEEDY